jgi:hypothetical protein
MDPNSITFEDYVAMSGAAKAKGLAAMMAHYGIDMNAWTQIATIWNGRIPSDIARYGNFGIMVEQEGARLAAGGPPRPLGQPPQQSFDQQANQAANAVGAAAVAGFGALGAAFNSVGTALAGLTPGSRVMVTWSDGQRYPGTVMQVAPGQVLVSMTDGRQMWMPSQYVNVM